MGLFDLFKGGNGASAPTAVADDIGQADDLIAQGHALEDAGRIDAALERSILATASGGGERNGDDGESSGGANGAQDCSFRGMAVPCVLGKGAAGPKTCGFRR